MDRIDFLASIGLSAATFTLINCAGCSKNSNSPSGDTSGLTDIDFTLNLTSSANATLTPNGGYLVSNGVVVAVQRSCTHESYGPIYQGSAKRFYCANHGATISENGNVTNGPGFKITKHLPHAINRDFIKNLHLTL